MQTIIDSVHAEYEITTDGPLEEFLDIKSGRCSTDNTLTKQGLINRIIAVMGLIDSSPIGFLLLTHLGNDLNGALVCLTIPLL
jgi:hypothetical protein